MIRIKARAKINLFLHVNGRNENNYHSLQSMVAFTDHIFDDLCVSDSNENQTILTLSKYSPKIDGENTVIKAINFLNKYFFTDNSLNIHINLQKNIPIASGLGGSSTDAASLINHIIKQNNMTFKSEIIERIAYEIGADVPVFLVAKACYFKGIGEQTEIINHFPDIWCVIVNPLKNLETKHVFKHYIDANLGYSKELEQKLEFKNTEELINFLEETNNDLTKSAINLMPEISDILDNLNKQSSCLISRMSGSGPSCFALFANEKDALDAYNNLKLIFPKYWVKYTSLG